MRDLFDSLRYPGFQKLAAKHVSFGIKEMIRSAFVGLAVNELKKYIPQIVASDITRYGILGRFIIFSNPQFVFFSLFYVTEARREFVHKPLMPTEAS